MKKIFATGAAVSMSLVVLAGCGGNDSGNQASSPEPSASAAAGSTDAGGASASAGPDLSKKLDLTIMSMSYGAGLTDDSEVVKKLDEKLNINLKIQWVPDANYTDKLNVLAASNNFPDAFMINPDFASKWSDKGIFMDLKPSLGNYPNLTQYLDESGFAFLSPAGKYYGLPYYTIEGRDLIAIRKDWLDKLNLQAPTTLDELEQVAKAFATQDPDGNGKDDTLGLTFSIDKNTGAWSDVDEMWYGFGLGNGWKEENGQLVPWQMQTDELKNFLTYMQKAYADGAIDKDFPVAQNLDAVKKWEAGKAGIVWVNPFEILNKNMPNLQKVYPDAQFVQLTPPKGPEGQGTKTFSAANKIEINAKIDPEKQQRLLALFDYMMSDEGFDLIKNGVEGVDYQKNDDGTYTKQDAFTTNNEGTLSTWLLRRYDPMIQIHKWDPQALQDQINGFFDINTPLIVRNPAAGLISATQTKVGSQIGVNLSNAMSKIVMGDAPVDSIDNAIAAWRSGGGDKIVQEINDAYNKLK